MSVWDDYAELKNRLVKLIILANVKTLPINASPGVIADHLIANDVTIRERGEWVKYPHNSGIYCSVCHGKARYKDIYKPFCPHCGADLRGEKDE